MFKRPNRANESTGHGCTQKRQCVLRTKSMFNTWNKDARTSIIKVADIKVNLKNASYSRICGKFAASPHTFHNPPHTYEFYRR